MLAGKDKISIQQATLLFLTITFSPAIRFVPSYGASEAKQAAWLAPIIAFLTLALLTYILQKIYKNNPEDSFADIMNKVFGFAFGKLILFFYLIWVMIQLILNVRFYGERIVTAIMPNTSLSLFIIIMLVLITLLLRSGIVVIARMNEIIIALVVLVFVILSTFMLANVEIENLTPISRLDIVPVFKASLGMIPIWGYFTMIFFFGHQINNKEDILKNGIRVAAFLLFANITLIGIVVGSLGASVTERLALPFFVAVKEISLFNILEKIESIIVAIWIVADFVLLTVFTYVVLSIIKSMFKLEETRGLISPLLLFVYFGSLYIANSRFELEEFADKISLPLNSVFQYLIPLIILTVGKIRKKI